MVTITRKPARYSTSQLPLTFSRLDRRIANSNPSTYEKLQSNTKTSKPWMVQRSPSSTFTASYHRHLDLIKSQSIRGINKKWKISVCVILTLLPWVPNFFKSQTLSSQKQKLDFILRDHKNIATYLHEITDDIAAGKKELHESTNKNHERYTQLKKVHGYLELDSEKYLEAERVEESLIARIDRIEELIQKNDRKQMEQKYTTGPIRVKFHLQNDSGYNSNFIVELNTKNMPHSSNHFLQMVELQLWDGLPLRRGLNNNLVASPSVVDKNHHSGLSRFSNSNLTHLAFQEYHPPPMQKYTLAFAGGQPAGPVFVIRMSDEVGIDEEHEATFASVVSGHDVLDLIVKIFIENPNSKNALKMDRIQILHGGSKAANKE